MGGDAGEGVGVEQGGAALGENCVDVADRLPARAGARSHHPRLRLAGLRNARVAHDLRPRGEHRAGARADVAHHPGGGRHRRGGAEHGRARVALGAGADRHDALRVLVIGGSRNRPRAPHLGGGGALNHLRTGRRVGEADVHQLDAAAGGRGEQVGPAQGTEGHGEGGGDVGVVDGAGVGVDAAGQVDGHPRHSGRSEVCDDPVRRGAQGAGAAQAHHAVDRHVGGSHVRGQRARTPVPRPANPPARTTQRGQPAGVCTVRVQQHGVDPAPTAPQHRPGVEGVSPVVAGADQQQHRPAVDAARALAQQGGGVVGQSGGGAAHHRVRVPGVGGRVDERALGIPDGLDWMCTPHRRRPPGFSLVVGPAHSTVTDLARLRGLSTS